jgi:hypothetical protein
MIDYNILCGWLLSEKTEEEIWSASKRKVARSPCSTTVHFLKRLVNFNTDYYGRRMGAVYNENFRYWKQAHRAPVICNEILWFFWSSERQGRTRNLRAKRDWALGSYTVRRRKSWRTEIPQTVTSHFDAFIWGLSLGYATYFGTCTTLKRIY